MPNLYIFVGPESHWRYSIRHSVWGARESLKLKAIWDRIAEGDVAILYCIGLKVVIGTATVAGRRTKKELWWPEEEEKRMNIYPYIVDLSDMRLAVDPGASSDAWLKTGLADFRKYGLTRGHLGYGMSRIVRDADSILAKVAEGLRAAPLPASARVKPPSPDHDAIRDMILEIGMMSGFPVDREYPIDDKRLDAVWKRVPQGNPTHAFEVQVSGDFFGALAKLKHAWDIWNALPVMVVTDKYEQEADKWLHGSFHEIQHIARIVKWQRIVELRNALAKVYDLKKEIQL
jgi:hypothetical protein